MNIRSNRVARPPRLMIIPMIDIIFFLMVFFLFSTLQMVYQKSMPVNLPVASSSHQEAPKPVAITLMKTCYHSTNSYNHYKMKNK